LPGIEVKAEVNATLLNLRAQMLELWADLNRSRDRGVNVTTAQELFVQLKARLEEAEGLRDRRNYFGAYQLLDDLKSLYNQTVTELVLAKQAFEAERAIAWWVWVVIGVVVAVIAILAYLLWPAKPGYYPERREYVWRPPKKKRGIGRLNKVLFRVESEAVKRLKTRLRKRESREG
jgi:hypothetical protein